MSWGGPAPIKEPKGGLNVGAAGLIEVAGWEATVGEHATSINEGVMVVNGLLTQLDQALMAISEPLKNAHGGQKAVAEGTANHAGRLNSVVEGTSDQATLDAARAVRGQVQPTTQLSERLGALLAWHNEARSAVGKVRKGLEEKQVVTTAAEAPDAAKNSARALKGAAQVLAAKGRGL